MKKKTKVKKGHELEKIGQSNALAVLKRLSRNKAAMLGLAILIIIIILAILAPVIAPYSYYKTSSDILQPPSLKHLFGTDDTGRDIFSRMLEGTRYSLALGILSVLIGHSIGIVLGAIAGYYAGKVDQVIMRLCDVLQAMPSLVLSFAVSILLGTGFFNCILALAVGGIAPAARLARSSILKTRKEEYLDAARTINCSSFRIILRHALPNILSPLIVSMTMGVAGCMLAAASLSYLGLGVQQPTPEWGAILSASRNYIRKAPYMSIIPGVIIMVTVLSINLLGDGLRDALDPKLKN